jgi:hypothetical protein
LAGQAEDALTGDIAHDLGAAAGDRETPGVGHLPRHRLYRSLVRFSNSLVAAMANGMEPAVAPAASKSYIENCSNRGRE